MRGMLYVTHDLKEFRAKNPEPVAKITEWKLNDLVDDLKRVKEHRNFMRGQLLFTSLACAQCHQLNKDTGSNASISHSAAGHAHGHVPSLAVGPNLADSIKKLKGDPKSVLQEILEPSRTIEEKYRKIMFELEDEVYVSGNVIAEDDQSITVQTGPTAAQEQKIAKKSIQSKRVSPLSIMPVGLLNPLDKEQILDLLAYVLSGGNANDPAFQHKH